MGRALVVFESMFGNTEAIAHAVAQGLGLRMLAEVVPVSQAPATVDCGVELLVVGAPTHAFGLSRPSTRRSALQQGARPAGVDVGVREWLAGLPAAHGSRRAVTFDTRVEQRGVPGSAARGAARRLRRLGYEVPTSRTFRVHGVPGPLLDGELDRARTWGVEMALHRPGRTSVATR